MSKLSYDNTCVHGNILTMQEILKELQTDLCSHHFILYSLIQFE